MPADDFIRLVAGDLLGAAVPGRDRALVIERGDGVVDHAVDQQAEAFLADAQGCLVGAPLGQVARYLREAQQRARGRPQGGDHHVGPEHLAVLAYPRGFFLETSLDGRHVELMASPLEPPRIRQEAREMRADDFIGLIAEDVLRAGIPGRDVAIDIEHEDGVIAHVFDQRAKARLR
jgi:hypothetical protein